MSGLFLLWSEDSHISLNIPVRYRQDTIIIEKGKIKNWIYTSSVLYIQKGFVFKHRKHSCTISAVLRKFKNKKIFQKFSNTDSNKVLKPAEFEDLMMQLTNNFDVTCVFQPHIRAKFNFHSSTIKGTAEVQPPQDYIEFLTKYAVKHLQSCKRSEVESISFEWLVDNNERIFLTDIKNPVLKPLKTDNLLIYSSIPSSAKNSRAPSEVKNNPNKFQIRRRSVVSTSRHSQRNLIGYTPRSSLTNFDLTDKIVQTSVYNCHCTAHLERCMVELHIEKNRKLTLEEQLKKIKIKQKTEIEELNAQWKERITTIAQSFEKKLCE